MKEVVLTTTKFEVRQFLGDFALESIQVEAIRDVALQGLWLQLRAFLLGRKVSENILKTIEIPETWWDAFKERYYPAWLLKQFPVKYRKIETIVQHMHICPHINVPFKVNQELHFKWLTNSDHYLPKPENSVRRNEDWICARCGNVIRAGEEHTRAECDAYFEDPTLPDRAAHRVILPDRWQIKAEPVPWGERR